MSFKQLLLYYVLIFCVIHLFVNVIFLSVLLRHVEAADAGE